MPIAMMMKTPLLIPTLLAIALSLTASAGTLRAQSGAATPDNPTTGPGPGAEAPAALTPETAPASAPVTAKTRVLDKGAYAKLVGDHSISLQWISWSKFGKGTVTDTDGVLAIEGEHRGDASNPGDYMTIKGHITEVDATTFTFNGTIVTRISHIAGGEAVTRQGTYTFAITKNRPYWRMQEMNNPKDGVVDYIDIYFRRSTPSSTPAAKPSGSKSGEGKEPKKRKTSER
ncbi:hypothetical protein DB346_12375 [Verrucomicrobia bacterium LW23]|nr:hypothetical protein DB346_12375 [Verrucomicrobia bacterium LW23]